jgi:hypothetical protein
MLKIKPPRFSPEGLEFLKIVTAYIIPAVL